MTVISILFLILVIVYATFSFLLFLISQKKKRGENHYLTVAFLIKSILHLAPALLIFNIDIAYSSYITGPIKVSILPLLYLYFVKLSSENKNIKKKDLVHFIPLFFDLILTLIIVPGNAEKIVSSAINGAGDLQKMFHPDNFHFNILAISGRSIMLFQGIVYSFLIMKLYKKYADMLHRETSLINSQNIMWIKWMAVLICFVGLFSGAELFGVYSYLPVFVTMFLFMIYFPFYLLLHAILQPEISLYNLQLSSDVQEKSSELVDQNKSFINGFMEKELFLIPELTLLEVSKKLKIPRYRLTEIIKAEGYKNFYAFVNEKRVDYSKDLLKNLPDHFSLNSVAIDSGFKSRSTFYRVFKEFTGLTPKQFMNHK